MSNITGKTIPIIAFEKVFGNRWFQIFPDLCVTMFYYNYLTCEIYFENVKTKMPIRRALHQSSVNPI